MNEKLVGVDELAEILSTPKSWVYSRSREKGPGSIPRIKCGKYVRFRVADVMDWLQKKSETE